MKYKHLLLVLGFLVTLFASLPVGFSLETWHNCSTDPCKRFFSFRICVNSTTCQCGVTANRTCSINPVEIANQTGAVALNTSQGNLSCCMCQSNDTFCCAAHACQVSTTPGASTTTSSSTTKTTTTTSITTNPSTTSSPLVEQAIIVAIFILKHDISTYRSRTQNLSLSFRYAVGNLTSTHISLTTVTETTFYSGVLPYCGFKVDTYVSDPNNIYSSSGQCSSMVINATMKKDVSKSKSLTDTIKSITDSVNNGKFGFMLWDGSKIKVSFLLSKVFNSSYTFHRGPYEAATVSPTKMVPPIHTNLWPLIYSAIGVFSLISLCVIWQCCKQSYLLRKKKYTDINSNRVNSRKKKLQEAMANQESTENEPQRERGMFDMTHSKLQIVDNEALTRRYDWTTPVYLPNMLAPAYAPTELHGQQSPPRLMLDDDDDSDSDKKSLGKASVINVDEETDEDLKDILESEDEGDVFKERAGTRQSNVSRKKSVSTSNKRKPSTTSKASKASHSTRNTSAKSTEKIPNPALGQARKCSYSGPEGRERTPSLAFGNLKSNRVTPVSDDIKSTLSSGKPRKKENSDL